MKELLIDQIDALLPQTQCGLCTYGGCRPYAQAIVESNETINRCPPGGVETLVNLAKLLQQDETPYLEEVTMNAKPPSIAVIREDECIGCTKCIQACPVDAILGAAKKMHTILTDECTGCELCIAPCPVDCIDMVVIETRAETIKKEKSALWRSRYQQRNERIAGPAQKQTQPNSNENSALMRKQAISEALERAKQKKEARNESQETV